MSNLRIVGILLGAAVVAIYFGLSDPVDGPSPKRNSANVVEVHEDDGAMNAASRAARLTVDRLTVRMSNLQARGADISIKVPLTENGVTEHIWISSPRFDGQMFHGVLGNHPDNLPSWSLGDSLSVAPGEISDWMVIDGGQLYGGFTLLVLRDRMSAQEQQRLEYQLGLALPDQPRQLP